MRKLIFNIAFVLLLPVGTVHAQADFATRLTDRLSTFYARHIPVKLHLFFNQPAYHPGDTAYFHISFLTAEGYKGFSGRQIIDVALVDDKNVPVVRQQVLVRDGFGYNQVAIPASLDPGNYTVTAYSDWMKNYDPELIYHTSLSILSGKELLEKRIYSTAFYPEGGNLIQQVSNKVVMMGTPGAKYSIVTAQGKEILTCTPDSTGLGVFYLTPQPGEQYFATANGALRTALPTSTDTGINLLLTPATAGGSLRIVLQAGTQTLREAGDKAYIIISAHGTAYYSAAIAFGANRTGVVSIPTAGLPAGVARATVFRDDATVLAERLFFVEEASPVQIMTTFDQQTYGTREKVTIKLHVNDPQGGKARLRVRVFQKDLFPQASAHLPRHPLQLSGELPYTAYRRYATAPANVFDNFLVTQHERLFSWPEVWNNTRAEEIHNFRTGLSFSGRAYRRNSSGPLPDSTHLTFFLQEDVMTYAIYPRSDGTFNFPLLNDFVGDDKVYYRADRKGVIQKDIAVDFGQKDTIPAMTTDAIYRETADHAAYGTFAEQQKVIEQAYGFAKRAPVQHYEKVNPHAFLEEEIFSPDVTINLRDYLLFPDMEETLREIIPFVQHRWHDKQHVVRMYITDLEVMGTEDPVYMIDGVLTDNTDYFMSLKPDEVATIKVVCTWEKLRTFGQIGKNGMVLVETTIPDNARNVPVPRNMVTVKGITPTATLPQTVNPKADRRYPQIKAALYWNPELTTNDMGDATISFYTPDNTGTYSIQIDGITYSGKPVFASDTFSVVFQPALVQQR
ncbi:hypothetical protein KK062_02540 [Fulvivirgaceae bacterium PWU5]|uniref:Macroglobulin domain-containing protein n=1 Tax=Dawidia cretensis TaxID=2782350 RepID=A0AAP2DTC7_9BACT|nr:hypothetical protein [Dawidia cretensis]MBT1707080.1 hypothetical protein [Dawidia cretensis]